MLTIRFEQKSVLRADSCHRLAFRLADQMRSCWPAECEALGSERLLARCEDSIRDAQRIGLRTDQAIARLLNLRFLLGDRFPDPDSHSGFYCLLSDKGLNEAQRLDYVWGRLLAAGTRK